MGLSQGAFAGATVSETQASVVVPGGAHSRLEGSCPIRVKGLRGSFRCESLDSTATAR